MFLFQKLNYNFILMEICLKCSKHNNNNNCSRFISMFVYNCCIGSYFRNQWLCKKGIIGCGVWIKVVCVFQECFIGKMKGYKTKKTIPEKNVNRRSFFFLHLKLSHANYHLCSKSHFHFSSKIIIKFYLGSKICVIHFIYFTSKVYIHHKYHI